MKIALLWPDYWPYIRRGTERMVHDIAGYLAGQGHDVHIIASKPGRGTITHNGAVTVHRLRQIHHPMLQAYRVIHRFDFHGLMVTPLLLRERFDLVHAFLYVYGPALKLARRLRGTPMVYHVVMIPPYWPRLFDDRLARACLASGAPVRVFSRYCAERLRSDYDGEPHIVCPTVDESFFNACYPRDRTRSTILFTADLTHPYKGAYLLAMAFNTIHRERPDTVLRLAGPVGFYPKALEMILGLIEPEARRSVELLGPGALANVPRLYAEAAVTVLPSLEEPFGMVLTESLASGTPVVGSRSGAIPEIVTDPAIGTLFERTDDAEASSAALARAVLQSLELADDPHTAARCRAHARRWTWQAVGPSFDALQAAALRGSP